MWLVIVLVRMLWRSGVNFFERIVMASKLNKPVTREVVEWNKGAMGKDGKRSLIITLNPGGFISFRLKGLRQDYDIDMAGVYTSAVRRWADKQMIEKKRQKVLRKQGLA